MSRLTSFYFYVTTGAWTVTALCWTFAVVGGVATLNMLAGSLLVGFVTLYLFLFNLDKE